ncbi:hypothetical protein BDZ91DRAFT_729880 [Kalaharituber pfeilii]|nr:hypothetical protein BDZ91DRAFT_729880 [Kalaharituber pfeilii]
MTTVVFSIFLYRNEVTICRWDLYFVFFFFFYSILFPYLILCLFYHCELADGLYFCSYCRGNVMITFRESCL